MVHTPRAHHLNGNTRPRPALEIIPDTRFVVFSGGEHEARPVKLTGIVRLTTPEPMSILKPKVRLEGKRKISWWFAGGMGAGEVVDKAVFWNVEQKLGGIESAHKVKAGTIEWPFEFELSPAIPESVEGLRETFIVYHLHASVSRPGWNTKDLLAQQRIRIVRTLGQDSMETTRSRVNADIWANKISYSISIPTDAVVFGTSIVADVELSPIKKGLRLGKIEMRLMETVVKRIQASEVPDARADRVKSDEAEVAKFDMDFPDNSRVLYEDETSEDPVMADEMYKFKACLPLPKSLNICRQDVDSHQINISHRFKLMVNIHNPEGHVSQLVCRLPVKLFISPNLPVDDRNEVCGTLNGVAEAQLNDNEAAMVAPPEYGRHLLDQMYSDIDPSGFMSTFPSAPGTPYGVNAQSRRGSNENIHSLNGIATADVAGDDGVNHGSAAPLALHSRLADLQARGHTVAFRSPGVQAAHSPSGGNSPLAPDVDPNGHSPPQPGELSSLPSGSNNFSPARISPDSSAQQSRRASEDEHGGDLHRVDYDIGNLSRVPSYGAALRTSGHVTPFTEVPPSYFEATSRPPSPSSSSTTTTTTQQQQMLTQQRDSSDTVPLIQRPDSAHLRSNTTVPAGPSTAHSHLPSPLAQARMPPPLQPTDGVAGGIAGSAAARNDVESRLTMLRART